MGVAGAGRAAAEAVGRALGGAVVVLRMPSPPVAGMVAEELGLPSPEFHDVTVAPCVVRAARSGAGAAAGDGAAVVMVPASVLEAALGVRGAAEVRQALRGVALVQVGGALLALQGVQALQANGSAYAYRLLLREAAAEAER